MTTDQALQWIQREQFSRWRLNRGKDDKVSEFDPKEETEDLQQSIERLSSTLVSLYPGQYTLKGWVGKGRQAAQSTFMFDVKQGTIQLPGSSSQSSQNFNADEIFKQAEASALMKFQHEQWKKDMEKRVEKLESDVLEIAKSIKDLHNDDDDDDDDALDRMTGIAERIPKLASGMGALRGMLNGK